MPKIKIKFFMDYICEFCYLSYWILEELKKENDLDIEYILFEIHPETPHEGIPMIAHMKEKTKFTENFNKILKDYDRKILDKDIFANTNFALKLGLFAQETGQFKAYTEGLWKAYMEEGKNISTIKDLYGLALQMGLNPNQLESILSDRNYDYKLFENHKLAESYGAEGVPTFIINEEYIMKGAQSQATWEELFKKITG